MADFEAAGSKSPTLAPVNTMIRIQIERKLFPTPGSSNEHVIVSDFNLHLKEHEFVCLVGPSGCGKTTLLNLVAGLDQAFEGKIEFKQQNSRLKIGYVFQNPRLLPWRTVRENIELAVADPTSSDNIDMLFDVMQLSDVQHVYPERLSLGMSRRVAIIRAFAINPDVLLMDEPFVSLDVPNARQIRELLISLWQQRPHTVLFVTHDIREAIALADRIVFLTANPMRILDEVSVSIERPQRHQADVIESFRNELCKNYPALMEIC
jgi:NitT/TauT family transport system ATP-binding protein